MSRVVVVLLLGTSAVAAPVPKGAKKDAHPTAVGTTWVYIHDEDEQQITTEEVTESVEKDGVTTFTVKIKATNFQGAPDSEKYRLKDGELALLATSQGRFTPHWTLWKPGLKDGDVWEEKCAMPGFTCELTTTVGQPEEVTVPAGKFTAVPLTQRYTKPAELGEVVIWYAEGVGMVKQTAGGKVQQELKSFTAGKGAKK